MALFKTKQSTVDAKLEATMARIAELAKRVAQGQKHLEEAKVVLGDRVTEAAMSDSEELQEAVTRARRVIDRTTSTLDDSRLQLEALEKVKAALEADRKRALLDEAPEKLTGIAKDFNKKVEVALGKLAELKAIQSELLKDEADFNTLLLERQAALTSLGTVQGLELEEGLGLLATASTPWRSTLQIPSETVAFLRALVSYRERLAGYLEFQKANPNFGEKAGTADKAGFGNVGSPDPSFVSFKIPVE